MPIQTRYGPILGRYADFSRGEFGALGGRHAQPGQWTGKNVVVYLDGSIGPRAGVQSTQPFSNTFDIFHPSPANVKLIGRERGGEQRFWVLDETDLVYGASYVSSLTVSTWHVYTGAVLLNPALSSNLDYVDDSTDSYVTSFAEGVFKLDHEAQTVVLLTGSPGGRAITIFGERLVVGGVSGAENQIQFSAPNNYNSWDPLDFIALGHPGTVIKSLQVQHNVLVIQTDHGDIFTISGVLSVNDDLRQSTSIAPRVAALSGERVSVTKRGIIWRRGRLAVPESFDGAQLRNLTHLNQWTVSSQNASQIAIVPGADDDDVLFFGSFGALLQLHNGAWSRHALGVATPAQTGIHAAYDGDGMVTFALNGASDGPHIYALALALEQPPVTAAGQIVNDASTGVAPNAFFTTIETRDSAGRGMEPRAVLVRFTKYLTGTAQTNHFEVVLSQLDIFESISPVLLACGTFDEANAAATTAGVNQSMMFPIDGGTDSEAFSVTINAIRGVKIEEIIVYGGIAKERAL